MGYCRCDEKVIEVSSEEFSKNPKEYMDQVKDNTVVRVVSGSGLKISIMTVCAPAPLHCDRCHKGILDDEIY
jgi:hypothetical protein